MDDVHSGGATSATVTCDDPSGTGLNWVTAPGQDPLHGFVQYDGAGGVSYFADADFAGSDSFQIEVDDNEGGASFVDVGVTVVNTAPACNSNGPFSARRVPRDAATALPLDTLCSDDDGDVIAFTRTSSPAHGTVTAGPAASLSYTPTAGYTGPDSFTFVAKDSAGGTSAVTTYYLDVVDSVAPSCTPAATVTLRPGQSRQIAMSCSDPNFETVTYKIVAGPGHGSLSPSGDSASAFRQYTAGSTAGADSYTYRATSSGGDSQIYTQNISIDPNANQAPNCFSNSFTPEAVHAGRSRSLNTTASCSDPDSDALTFTPDAPAPQHGSVVVSAGALVYTAVAGYTGSDTIGYLASDGHGGVVHGTYSVTVDDGSLNAAPACSDADATTPNGAHVEVPLVCTDADGDYVTLVLVSAPDAAQGSLGAIDQGARVVDFTPVAGYSGPVTFTFKGSDGTAESAPATVTVTVQPASPSTDGGDSGGSGTPPPSGGTPDGGAAGTQTDAGSAPGTPPAGGPVADTTPPGLVLGALPKLKVGQFLKKGLGFKLTLTEAGKTTAKLLLSKKIAKQVKLAAADVTVAQATRALGAGPSTFVVKVTPKARKKLAKLRSLRLKLSIVVLDAAGNRASVTKTLSFAH